MGWKSRVREIANRNPEGVPETLLPEQTDTSTQRKQLFFKILRRNIPFAMLLIAALFGLMLGLGIYHERRLLPILTLTGIASLIGTGIFSLVGGTVIEDAVQSLAFLVLGLLLPLPMPYGLTIGVGAVVGSIAARTVRVSWRASQYGHPEGLFEK